MWRTGDKGDNDNDSDFLYFVITMVVKVQMVMHGMLISMAMEEEVVAKVVVANVMAKTMIPVATIRQATTVVQM